MAQTIDQAVQAHLGALVMQAIVLDNKNKEQAEKIAELEAQLAAPAELEVVR